MKFIKFLGISLLVVLLIALVPLGRDYISLYQIYIDGGGGSSGGGTYVPPSDEPPNTDTGNDSGTTDEGDGSGTGTYKNVWHTSEHEYHYFEPITCNACGTTFTDMSLFEPLYTDSYMYSDTRAYKFVEAKCPSCFSTNGNFQNELNEYHCYVDGVCHDCGSLCSHKMILNNYADYGFVLYGLSQVCPAHPLLTSDVTYENGDSFVVNGTCQLCLCSDYDDVGLMYKDDNGFILRTVDGGQTYQIVGYMGTGGELTLPTTFDDKPVTKVCSEALSGKSVTQITVPDGMELDGNAFSGCTTLTKIVIERDETADDGTLEPWGAPEGVEVTYASDDNNAGETEPDTGETETPDETFTKTYTCNCWEVQGTLLKTHTVPNDANVDGFVFSTDLYSDGEYNYEAAYDIHCENCGWSTDDYFVYSKQKIE